METFPQIFFADFYTNAGTDANITANIGADIDADIDIDADAKENCHDETPQPQGLWKNQSWTGCSAQAPGRLSRCPHDHADRRHFRPA